MNVYKEALVKEQQDDVQETASLLGTLGPKSLAEKGLASLNLQVLSIATSLGGRTIAELGPDKAIGDIFEPCVKVGDIVSLKSYKSSGKDGIEAVVTKVSRESLNIAIDDDDVDIPDGRVWLSKLTNNATYKRMNWALDKIASRSTKLALLAQGDDGASPSVNQVQDINLFDPTLNGPQIDAIKYALGSDVCVIHGPPGTGKTSTLVEIVRQLVANGERVLVCGPSNISVDNIIERLSGHFKAGQLVRLGHPARLLESVQKHSIDILSKSSNSGQVLRELKAEIDGIIAQIKKSRGRSKKELYANIKDLRKDLRQREKAVVNELLLNAKVVVSTLHTAGSVSVGNAINSLDPRPLFNSIIIDEVSQAMIPQCMIPVAIEPKASRLIIAGDNKQLPPTIMSKDSKTKKILEKTLFDLLVESYGDSIKHLITVQYRMSKEIMDFPSKSMYGGKLIAAESVACNRLYDLEHVERNSITESTVYWIDTLGDMFPEFKEEDAFSTKNEGECRLVKDYLSKLLDSGVKPEEVGVISPYAAQVGILKKELPEKVEVSTVDGFQGREKEVIIISLVRSNDTNDVGFVADERRINVAITRPKRQLCIVGNSETIGKSGYLKDWVQWCQDNADIEYAES